jgi:DNA (cytosine-5)-methyltransferase 1
VRVGSLFSGIGGIDLGLERAGMTVIWQSEIEPYACRVLAKHWPDVPNLGDVKRIDWSTVERPDLICGGYPCQPFSVAGQRGGAGDPRHLWPDYRDALRVLRPRWAVLENVPGHLSLGFGRVLGDLAELGYDTDWDCIPAAAVGAPHLRYRVFVVAHTNQHQHEGGASSVGGPTSTHLSAHAVGESEPGGTVDAVTLPGVMVPDAPCFNGERAITSRDRPRRSEVPIGDSRTRTTVAYTDGSTRGAAGSASEAVHRSSTIERPRRRGRGERDHWAVEPDVGRVAHGVPNRVDRLRALGNAVVPQVAEWIGRRILEAAA